MSSKYEFMPYTYGLIVCGFSLGVFGVFTSMLSVGPVAVAGGFSVTVAAPLIDAFCVLVAVTVTVAGAG